MIEKNKELILEPFDLERYKAGEKVHTRGLYPVIDILSTDQNLVNGDSIVAILNINGEHCVDTFRSNGTYYDSQEDPFDLMMEKKIKTLYVHVYKNQSGCYDSIITDRKEFSGYHTNLITTFELEI